MRIALCCVAISALLGGCAPELIYGNEAGGTVSNDDSLSAPRAGAMMVADTHCAKFGKVARVSARDFVGGTLTFDCVKP